jgi:hypothetical protein
VQRVSLKDGFASNNISELALTSTSDRTYNGDLITSLCAITDRALAANGLNPNLLRPCEWESPESSYGACDGQVCLSVATVYCRDSHREYCNRHFKQVSR